MTQRHFQVVFKKNHVHADKKQKKPRLSGFFHTMLVSFQAEDFRSRYPDQIEDDGNHDQVEEGIA